MNVYRVNEVWQLALVHSVRIANAIDLNIPLPGEFNEKIDGKYHYVLAEEGIEGLGTLRINFDHPDYAKIERVAVHPSHQGKGIGRIIIKEAEQWIKDAGYSKIVVHSKNSAQGFYQALDYDLDPTVHLEDGPDKKPQIYFKKDI